MKKIVLLLCTAFIVQLSFGQNGNFRSRATGNWGTAATWDRDTDSNGLFDESPSTLAPTSADGTIVIQSGDVVTVAASVTTDQTTIDSGGQITINGSQTLTVGAGNGDDLTINGTLLNNGTLTIFFQPAPPAFGLVRVNGTLNNASNISGSGTSNLIFENGSTYGHQQNGGAIPTSTWSPGSTCSITGVTTTVPSGLGGVFDDFTWNCTGQTGFIDFGGALTTVNGDLSFLATNGQATYLTVGSNYTLNVGNDFIVNGSYIGFNSSAITATVNVTNNFTASNSSTIDYTFSGAVVMDVNGAYSLSGGATNFSFIGSAGNVSINVAGDFSLLSSPSIINGGTGTYTLTLDGISNQDYTASTAFTDFDYIIAPSAIVTIDGSSSFLGAGDFTLNSTSTFHLASTHASGALQTGTTNGNMRISGARDYISGATMIYNGSAAQTLGNNFPANVNLEVNNASGVSLTAGTTISVGRTLTLTTGNLSIGENSLTLIGDVVGSGGLVGGSLSDLTIGGTGAFGTLTFSGTTTLNDFVMNRTSSGSITLGSDLTIPSTGSFTQTAGNVILNGNTFTLSGVISRTDGAIVGTSTSSLIIDGSGTITGNIDMSGSLETFTLDRAGATLTTGASMAITNLNLNSGTFANGAGISIVSGGTLTRQHNGSMNTAPSATSYNVVYNIGNPITTGPELLTSTTALQNFTKQGGAALTVDQATTVNGVLRLSSGTFSAGGFAIDMKGNFVSDATSDFSSNLVTFSGTTVISGTTVPSFNDLTVAGSSSLTTPSGSMTVAGTTANNGTFNASSTTLNLDGAFTNSSVFTAPSGTLNLAAAFTNNGTFTNNGGTVVIDGAAQSISGSALTAFNDLTLSNSGTATINGIGSSIAGALTMSASSALNANGKITLLSTGTNSSNTARVAAIPPSATVSGDFIYQRFISGAQQFHNIGLPVTGGTTADITTSGYPDPDASLNGDFIRYNEATTGDQDQGWESSKTGPFSAISGTQGYTFWTRTADNNKTLSVAGPLNTSNVSLSVSYTDDVGQPIDQDGWNLVNNPYASQISWADLNSGGWSSSSIDGTIYVWNGSGYNAINGSGFIASGQSFWVHANAGSPTLTATQTVKTSSNTTFFRPEGVINDLTITLSDATRSDLTRIRFLDGAIEEFDSQHDGYKLENSIYNLSSMTVGGMDLSLNTLSMNSCNRTTKLNITNINEGNYELSFADVTSFGGLEITLRDNFLNEDILLSEGFTYLFDITADDTSKGDTRFEVVFSGIVTETNLTTTTIDNCDDESVSITIDNSQNGLIYTLLNGQEIVATTIGNAGQAEIQVQKALLTDGTNTFDMTIGNEVCGSVVDADNQIVFEYEAISEVTTVEGGNNCGEGSIIISAEGASETGHYNWYESIDATEPIANESASSFTTPQLQTSTTYYVAVVNPLGCESITRVPVDVVINELPETPEIIAEGTLLVSTAKTNNQWYKDDMLIEGATFSSYEAEESGSYTVTVENANGCKTTSQLIELTITTIVADGLSDDTIRISPNPVGNEDLTVSTNQGLKYSTVLLYNNQGKLMMTKEIESANEIQINMGLFNKGIYFLHLTGNNGSSVYKILKN